MIPANLSSTSLPFCCDRSRRPNLGRQSRSSFPRLLLAEANFPLCVFLCELLARDYAVEVATGGEQALHAAQREPPDLLLANVRLPVLDGLELTRRLRLDVRMVRLPILLLTANSDPLTLQRIMAGGVDQWMFQPFRPEELLARLRRLLPRQRPGRN